MFELRYFTGAKELVPCGWQSNDEDKQFPLLSSRNPQLQQAIPDAVNDYDMTNGQGSEGSDEDDALSNNTISNTRMTEESSDEDELAPRAPFVSRNFPFSV